ncbi:Transcriptional adapter ADA2a, partial [Tetrabaena socialis]
GMGMGMGAAGGGGSASVNSAASSSALDLSRPAASVPMGRGAGAALALWRARRGVPLDITPLPGVELLSGRERELCADARLLPPHYLALKDMLLREGERGGGGITRQEARTFFRLEPARSLRVYDLLVSAGWVSGGGAEAGGGVQWGKGSGGGSATQLRALMAGGEGEAGGADGDDASGADPMEADQ